MSAKTYVIRRKVFTLFGAKFHVYDEDARLIGFIKQKAFKLKEDFRVYSDETMATERLVIKARQIIDFSAGYDVVDSRTQEKLGVLQRKGFSSMLRDAWIVLDEQDQEVGQVQEDSMFKSIVRRFSPDFIPISFILPQSFHLKDDTGTDMASFQSNVNPFVRKLTVNVYPDCDVSPLLVLAAGILLAAIEGRQR